MCRFGRAAACIFLLALVSSHVEAGKKPKMKDMVISKGWPEVTEQQKSLKEVPGSAGVPAAVLLQYKEHEWQELEFLRTRMLRRIKILTGEGIEEHGSYRFTLYGDWRVKDVHARTVLPDGTVIDAADNINMETSDRGLQVIHVSFPQVQVGAILDLDVNLTSNPWGIEPWRVQQSLPVIDTRLVLKPPLGLRFRIVPMWLPPAKSSPDASFNMPGNRKAHTWRMENVAALPSVANLPPASDIAQTLIVVLESFRGEYVNIPIASDWKSYGEETAKFWNDFMGKGHSRADALARKVTVEATDPVEKAEAIRKALKDQFNVTSYSLYRSEGMDNPDDILEAGSGSSGALAVLATAMLRSVGVDADLSYIRRRSDGMVPVEIPIPAMLDDILVRIPKGNDYLYFSPASDQHVTEPEFDCSGILAFPLDGEADRPVPLPDFSASDNQVIRNVNAEITLEGDLHATTTEKFRGVAAEFWRNSLRNKDEEDVREEVQDRLQRYVPGAVVEKVEITNLDNPAEKLKLECGWKAEGYATTAGKRLILNPFLYNRISSADWAPDERSFVIDLEAAVETMENVNFKVPEEVVEIDLPDTANLDAGAVGSYVTSFTHGGRLLMVKRHFRLNQYRFPSNSYPGLKGWFTAIASVDEKPLVLKLR